MSSTRRLGPWEPTTADDRLDRLESLAAIQQLPARYALAVDSRDLDGLMDLFVPDVRVSRDQSGRAALRAWYLRSLAKFRTSVHFVGEHVVDFDDADHARGVVYCHDELDGRSPGTWELGKLQYWDTYARVDGEWYFTRRKFHRFYIVDALERPEHGAGTGDDRENLTTHVLPDAFDTWAPFWDEVGTEPY